MSLPAVVNTNATSLISLDRLRINSTRLDRAASQMASGKKITKPSDDAAGYSRVRQLQGRLLGYNQAVANLQDGLSLMEVTESTLGLMGDNLQRIRELALGMSTETNTTESRLSYAKEIKNLMDDLQRLATTAEFNGVRLLDGTAANDALIQTGFGSNTGSFTLNLGEALENADLTSIGLLNGANSGTLIPDTDAIFDGTTSALNTTGAVLNFIDDVDAAMNKLQTQRSTVGAFYNQLERAMTFTQTVMVNTEQSRSRLEDADIAKVSSEYAQADVLRQAAVSILSQSNIRNQDAINLLQR